MRAHAAIIAGLTLLGATAARADILFQSAEAPDHSFCCGFVQIFSGANSGGAGNPQWLGVRFQLTQRAEITGIGADFSLIQGTIFGAIIKLPDLVSLPSGDPFTPGQVVVERTIDSIAPVDPVHVVLAPGDYGLIFGSGAFGTEGFSGIWQTTVTDPDASFFFYGNQGVQPGGAFWREANFHGTQFTVEGRYLAAPEPSAWLLMGLGFLSLGAALRHESWTRSRQRLVAILG